MLRSQSRSAQIIRTSLHVRSLLCLAGLAVLTLPATAFCQLNSSTVGVNLNATLTETLWISVTPSNVNFTLVPGGSAVGSAPVVITTGWQLRPGHSTVLLDGYFSSTSAALTDGGTPANNIPTSEVLGQMPTGELATYTAFTQTTGLGPAGAGLEFFSQKVTGANRNSSRTDNLNLEINLSSQPLLPPGVYTGTLTIQAQSN